MHIVRFLLLSLWLCLPLAANSLKSHHDYSAKAWEYLKQKNWEQLIEVTDACIKKYGKRAKADQSKLSAPPKEKKEVNRVGALNNVAICAFLKGEAYRNQGKTEEAKVAYQTVIDEYSYGQAWDKQGWFWQVSKASQKAMAKL
jgi:tetratricopeptide (TPR) repeat protein